MLKRSVDNTRTLLKKLCTKIKELEKKNNKTQSPEYKSACRDIVDMIELDREKILEALTILEDNSIDG
jgi:hypothetical protein